MDYLKEALRLVHILGGMYWFGSVLAMYYFITPTVAATGDAGQQFMRQLGGKSGFSTSILIAALSAAAAGVWLYWIDSNGLQSDWLKSSSATVFGLGGLFGAIALVLGIIVNRTLAALGKVGAQIQGKPTPEQMARIQTLQKRAGMATQYTCYMLIVAAICMSLARYFVF